MEATALILLAAGVGVGYGWQPMPDGSSRYEYVVQVEPELLATLDEDGSIPIVSEVPDDIRPIGRIRIVVGRGDLPRQRLVKRMKPTGEAAPATGDGAIELTQYNEYGAPVPRYGQGQAAISPDASSWNGGEAQSAAPASAPGSAWNDGPVSVAERTGEPGPMSRVGDHIDDATAPLRQGLERVDNGVRAAVGNLGDRTRNLVDELGRPLQPGANPADSRAPLGTDPNITSAPTWNGGAPTGAAAAAQAPRYAGESNAWNESDAPTLPEAPAFAGAAPGLTNPAAGQARSPADANWNSPAPSAASQRLDQPIDPRDVGRWDNVAPTTGPGAAAGQAGRGVGNRGDMDYRRQADARDGRPSAAENPAGFPTDWARDGQRLPAFGNTPAANPSAPVADAASRGADATAGVSPKIDSRMLQQPANRPLEGTDAAQAAASNLAGPEFPLAQQRPASNSPQTPDPRATAASAQGWDFATRGTANQAGGAQGPPAGNGRQAAAALFAWVLLISSAAGNLYLFWSYQDVRYKYRSLVRKSARAVGSRLSAA